MSKEHPRYIRRLAGEPPVGHLFCTKCKKFLPYGNFTILVGDNRDSSWCKDCQQTYRYDQHIKRSYGVSKEDYQRMKDAQHGLCPVCGKVIKSWPRMPALDHDHETGKFRGILCQGCNVLIGHGVDVLWNAIAYLKKHGVIH